MNGRRVTALLLTAFLVAEAMIRLQGGITLPAAAPDVWNEIAQGSYRAAAGSYLVPAGSGGILRRTSRGTSPAKPAWSTHFNGSDIAVYGHGSSAMAVASTASGWQVLPRYGKGFLLADKSQNLWLVSQGRARLLMGGGAGAQSRTALLQHMRSLQAAGKVSRSWTLLWAADPVVVGKNVWFLTNRDRQIGTSGVDVWQLTAQGASPLTGLAQMGITSLVGSGSEGVLAEDAKGELLVIDPTTHAVRVRMPGADALAVGAGGEALLLQAAPGKSPQLFVLGGSHQTPYPLSLPSGTRALGPAGFSASGDSIALLVQRKGRTLVYVARVKGLGAGQPGDLLAPPGNAQIESWAAPSLASGRVYLVVRVGGTTQTWERSVGDGQTAFALHGLG